MVMDEGELFFFTIIWYCDFSLQYYLKIYLIFAEFVEQ